jgi:hypothetical protein
MRKYRPCGSPCYHDPVSAADQAARQYAAGDFRLMPLVSWCDPCEAFHIVDGAADSGTTTSRPPAVSSKLAGDRVRRRWK